MIFRQLFEPVSCTYTYLLGCSATGGCALIDPVLETVERDLAVISSLGLHLAFTVETHVHADHLTGALKLKHLAGSQIAGPALDGLLCTDAGLHEGEPLMIGEIALQPLFTPGHTSSHHAYLIDAGTQQLLFSGDALLIDGCGRTDFQSGDPVALYHSIHDQFFTLPDETLVYPGHDYEGRFVSSIAQEKARNSRLGGGKSLEEFVKIMKSLDLPPPQKMAFAVPGNLLCGQCPPNVPDALRLPCAFGDQG
ncbi:MAG TPA: Zn-dependent hydrolase [Gammaproteobacteria bacterium]|nr:Zn-dependent hydrolase [Gammaproteobacteria bacterium]HRF43370.1 MBL fold metallo-hydrolase [Candidatus Competibacteraceae bacterium]